MSTISESQLTVDQCVNEGIVASARKMVSVQSEALITLDNDLTTWWDRWGNHDRMPKTKKWAVATLEDMIGLLLQDRRDPEAKSVATLTQDITDVIAADDRVIYGEEKAGGLCPYTSDRWIAEGHAGGSSWRKEVPLWIEANRRHALRLSASHATIEDTNLSDLVVKMNLSDDLDGCTLTTASTDNQEDTEMGGM